MVNSQFIHILEFQQVEEEHGDEKWAYFIPSNTNFQITRHQSAISTVIVGIILRTVRAYSIYLQN